VLPNKVDGLRAPEYEFLDGRGQWVEYGNLGVTGSVALRQRSGVVEELIDMYGNDRIAFQAKTAGVLMAYDPKGRSLGKIELTSPPAAGTSSSQCPVGECTCSVPSSKGVPDSRRVRAV
jgi:hypothetical protein